MPRKVSVSKTVISGKSVVPAIAIVVLMVGLVTSMILGGTNQDKRSAAYIAPAPTPASYLTCCRQGATISCPASSCTYCNATTGRCASPTPVGSAAPAPTPISGVIYKCNTSLISSNNDCYNKSVGNYCFNNAGKCAGAPDCKCALFASPYPTGTKLPQRVDCCINNINTSCIDKGNGCRDCPGWNTSPSTTSGICYHPRPEYFYCLRPGQTQPSVPFGNTTCETISVNGVPTGIVFNCPLSNTNMSPFNSQLTNQLCGVSCVGDKFPVTGRTTWDDKAICGTYSGPTLVPCCINGTQQRVVSCPANLPMWCWEKNGYGN